MCVVRMKQSSVVCMCWVYILLTRAPLSKILRQPREHPHHTKTVSGCHSHRDVRRAQKNDPDRITDFGKYSGAIHGLQTPTDLRISEASRTDCRVIFLSHSIECLELHVVIYFQKFEALIVLQNYRKTLV